MYKTHYEHCSVDNAMVQFFQHCYTDPFNLAQFEIFLPRGSFSFQSLNLYQLVVSGNTSMPYSAVSSSSLLIIQHKTFVRYKHS